MVRITFAVVLALAAAAIAVTPNTAGAKNVGTGNGAQFITGGCTSNADCSSGCCAGNPTLGVCSNEVAALQAGKTGCGFTDPNADQTIAASKAQVAKQGFRRSIVRKSKAEVAAEELAAKEAEEDLEDQEAEEDIEDAEDEEAKAAGDV